MEKNPGVRAEIINNMALLHDDITGISIANELSGGKGHSMLTNNAEITKILLEKYYEKIKLVHLNIKDSSQIHNNALVRTLRV
jgi:hypothetical protein